MTGKVGQGWPQDDIDGMVLRNRDASTPWHEAADATREERFSYCQNWRADVSAALTDTGKMVEWV